MTKAFIKVSNTKSNAVRQVCAIHLNFFVLITNLKFNSHVLTYSSILFYCVFKLAYFQEKHCAIINNK